MLNNLEWVDVRQPLIITSIKAYLEQSDFTHFYWLPVLHQVIILWQSLMYHTILNQRPDGIPSRKVQFRLKRNQIFIKILKNLHKFIFNWEYWSISNCRENLTLSVGISYWPMRKKNRFEFSSMISWTQLWRLYRTIYSSLQNYYLVYKI